MATNIGTFLTIKGDTEYAKAMKQLRSDMSLVKAEAEAVAARFGKNEKSVESLTEKNESLSQALKLQEQALEESRAAMQRLNDQGVEETAENYQKAQINILKAEAALETTKREIRENEQAIAGLNEAIEQERLKKLTKEAKAAAEEFERMNSKLDKVATGALTALVASATAAASAVYAHTRESAAWADEIATLSAQTGLSVQELQELDYVAKLIDTDLSVVTSALARTSKVMYETSLGTGRAKVAMEELNITVLNNDGTLRDHVEVFYEIIDKLGAMENATQRDALAIKIFGESAQKLNPLIKAGAEGLREVVSEANALGTVIEDDAITALGKFDDQMQRLDSQLAALKRSTGAAFAPSFVLAAEEIERTLQCIRQELDKPKTKAQIAKLGESLAALIRQVTELVVKGLPPFINILSFAAKNFTAITSGVLGAIAATKGLAVINKAVKWYKNLAAAQASAQATNPAGWISLAVTALTALVGAIAGAVKAYNEQLYASANALNDAVADYKEAITEIESSYEHSVESSAAAADMATGYIDRLDELGAQVSMTAIEQAEYNATVDKLNALMPELNLTIDEQTGLVNANTDAIRDQVNAITEAAKAEAYKERVTELMREQLDLQTAYNKAVLEEKTTGERLKKLALEIKAIEELTEAEKRYTISSGARYSQMSEEAKKLIALRQEQHNLALQQDKLTEAIANASGALEENQTLIDDVTEGYNLMADATDESSAAAEDITAKLEAEAEAFERVTAEADRMKAVTVDALNSVNDTIKETEIVSIEDMINTLRDNTQALRDYNDDLLVLKGKGLSDAAISMIRSWGIEYAASVDEMANAATDAQIEALNLAITEGNLYAEEYANLWEGMGLAIGEGLEEGISAWEHDLIDRMRGIARQMLGAYGGIMEISSPSKAMRKMGKYTMEGLEYGLEEGGLQVISNMTRIANDMLRPFGTTSLDLPSIPRQSINGRNTIIQISDPSPAYMEYMYSKINNDMGAAI